MAQQKYQKISDKMTLVEFEDNVKSSLLPYNNEKLLPLLTDRIYDSITDLLPEGFVMAMMLIEYDIQAGVCGYTGKEFQPSQITLFNREIVNLARTLFGQEFANSVESQVNILRPQY